ncbi:DUF2784 domain-containing protein [Spongiactinospora sp. TRM90649]|uniref:DUF2784 domain-containing protein n=1 Tax=Spongiactinospora sp. TRM90649 TaxID=3031114 RepID=UPI0023F79735|nr:DUF2784 domain-containing protein [Spongiactinospora sp. TRM90649]MDF5755970.1 DUF2784 domain-containing protein [Spongiactinospora sp. TRM90649]
MGYRILAEVTMGVHLLVLIYLALGGFLAWPRPLLIWPHLAMAAWGLASISTPLECPLTVLENWARHRAGLAGLRPGGFIDTYLKGVIYPEEYTTLVRWVVVALILTSWTGLVMRRRAGHRRARGESCQVE